MKPTKAVLVPVPIKWVEIREAICDHFDDAKDKHEMCRKLSKRLGYDALLRDEMPVNSPRIVMKSQSLPK